MLWPIDLHWPWWSARNLTLQPASMNGLAYDHNQIHCCFYPPLCSPLNSLIREREEKQGGEEEGLGGKERANNGKGLKQEKKCLLVPKASKNERPCLLRFRRQNQLNCGMPSGRQRRTPPLFLPICQGVEVYKRNHCHVLPFLSLLFTWQDWIKSINIMKTFHAHWALHIGAVVQNQTQIHL